mmetsp:Transcript_1397/g.3051  ORF Transcript_1397/g.3051 Transcript_1397/m.3051 type:complete len:378 (+) Transcript_1397:229-1362(+)
MQRPFLLHSLLSVSALLCLCAGYAIAECSGSLTGTSVAVRSLVAFEYTQYTFSFTPGPSGFGENDTLQITFPDEFDLSRIKFVSAGFNGTSNTSLSVSGDNVAISRRNGKALSAADGSLDVILGQVRNYYAGTTGDFRFRILRRGAVQDCDTSVPGLTFTAASLLVKSVSLGSSLAEADTSIAFSLKLGGVLNYKGRDGGMFLITFPEGFYFENGVASVTADMTPYSDQLAAHVESRACTTFVWMNCTTVRVNLTNPTAEYPTGTIVDFTLSSLKNRPVTGLTGTFTIQTTNLKGQVSDESTDMELELSGNNATLILWLIAVTGLIVMTGICTRLEARYRAEIAPQRPRGVFQPNCQNQSARVSIDSEPLLQLPSQV